MVDVPLHWAMRCYAERSSSLRAIARHLMGACRMYDGNKWLGTYSSKPYFSLWVQGKLCSLVLYVEVGSNRMTSSMFLIFKLVNKQGCADSQYGLNSFIGLCQNLDKHVKSRKC